MKLMMNLLGLLLLVVGSTGCVVHARGGVYDPYYHSYGYGYHDYHPYEYDGWHHHYYYHDNRY
jgi:hypothetical protein